MLRSVIGIKANANKAHHPSECLVLCCHVVKLTQDSGSIGTCLRCGAARVNETQHCDAPVSKIAKVSHDFTYSYRVTRHRRHASPLVRRNYLAPADRNRSRNRCGRSDAIVRRAIAAKTMNLKIQIALTPNPLPKGEVVPSPSGRW